MEKPGRRHFEYWREICGITSGKRGRGEEKGRPGGGMTLFSRGLRKRR